MKTFAIFVLVFCVFTSSAQDYNKFNRYTISLNCDTLKIKKSIVLTDKLLIDFLNEWERNSTDSIFCFGTSIEMCDDRIIRVFKEKHFIGVDKNTAEPSFMDFIRWLRKDNQ